MSARRRPPASVLALQIITGFTALLQLVTAALAFVVWRDDAADLTTDERAALGLAVVVLGVSGLALVAVVVGLARRSNMARMVLTLIVGFRMIFGAFDWLQRDVGDADALGVWVLGAALLTLAWVPSSRRWFQTDRERALGEAASLRRRSPGRRVAELAVQAVVLGVTVWVTPGVGVSEWYSVLFAAAAVVLVTAALQPVLAGVAGRFGWLGVLLVALFANVTTLGLALWLTPGITVSSVWWAFVASWVFAALMAVVTWLFSVGTEEYLLVHASRMALDESEHPTDGARGVVMIQLDGVPAPLLENEIRSGNLPTISRWVRSGSHTWTEWTARVPSTTPVSQSGILHGRNDNIPAFRWWDRDLGRLLVANKPADAREIESRMSSGDGLLADDGVSISNLFTGDAPTSYLTMSTVESVREGLGSAKSYASFFAHPAGFARAFMLTLGEMVKEVAQARRQERRGVEPRVHRGGAYVLLRGITNVMLRDMNVSLVVGAMMRGRKSVYVDFVDYDEIAHHAGVTRPESLASLYGLDSVLATLERFAAAGLAPREYDFVLVSDHGQSQGATFLQRSGETLEEFVARHTGGRAVTDDQGTEGAGAGATVLVRELAAEGSRSAKAAARRIDRDREAGASAPADEGVPNLAVVGSGNLGGIWFTDAPQRQSLADIDAAHPDLLAALAQHDAIGFVVVRGTAGPVAIGPHGVHHLHSGEVTGADPLAGFPSHTAADFARAAEFPDAPDIYVNSTYDPVLDEVSAFEELVGCHGGVGGWQTRPLLVFPRAWELDQNLLTDGRLYGADAVHRQLVAWLEALGHRGAEVAERSGAEEEPG